MFNNMKCLTVFFAFFTFTFSIQAEDKRVYSENDFINIFSGKPKARFLKYLGEPADKQIAIKPKDASKVISRPTDNISRTSALSRLTRFGKTRRRRRRIPISCRGSAAALPTKAR